jgi:hypothetical protein
MNKVLVKFEDRICNKVITGKSLNISMIDRLTAFRTNSTTFKNPFLDTEIMELVFTFCSEDVPPIWPFIQFTINSIYSVNSFKWCSKKLKTDTTLCLLLNLNHS